MKSFLTFIMLTALAGCLQNCSSIDVTDPTPTSSSTVKSGARSASCSSGQGISYSFAKEGPNDGNDHYYAPGSAGYKKQIKVQLYAYSGGFGGGGNSSRNVQLMLSGQLTILRVVSSTTGSVSLNNYANNLGGYQNATWNVSLPNNQNAELILEVTPPSSEGVEYLSMQAPCYEIWDRLLNNDTAHGDSSVQYYVIRNSTL